MPEFTNQPPARPRTHSMRLIRTQPGKPIAGYLTCTDMVGCETHFWGGRTVPCEGDACAACLQGIASRWHGYLSIWDPGAHGQLLVEVTEEAARQIQAYAKSNGSLRGAIIQLHRANYRRNSRLVADLKAADLSKVNLPPAPNIIAILETIWGLNKGSTRATQARNSTPTIEARDGVNQFTEPQQAGNFTDILLRNRGVLPATTDGNGQK